jgi:hypothetical protein
VHSCISRSFCTYALQTMLCVIARASESAYHVQLRARWFKRNLMPWKPCPIQTLLCGHFFNSICAEDVTPNLAPLYCVRLGTIGVFGNCWNLGTIGTWELFAETPTMASKKIQGNQGSQKIRVASAVKIFIPCFETLSSVDFARWFLSALLRRENGPCLLANTPDAWSLKVCSCVRLCVLCNMRVCLFMFAYVQECMNARLVALVGGAAEERQLRWSLLKAATALRAINGNPSRRVTLA